MDVQVVRFPKIRQSIEDYVKVVENAIKPLQYQPVLTKLRWIIGSCLDTFDGGEGEFVDLKERLEQVPSEWLPYPRRFHQLVVSSLGMLRHIANCSCHPSDQVYGFKEVQEAVYDSLCAVKLLIKAFGPVVKQKRYYSPRNKPFVPAAVEIAQVPTQPVAVPTFDSTELLAKGLEVQVQEVVANEPQPIEQHKSRSDGSDFEEFMSQMSLITIGLYEIE